MGLFVAPAAPRAAVVTGEPRFALVTGAGSGIGRACAAVLAEDGHRVTLVGRRLALLEAAAAAIPGALAVAADLSTDAGIGTVADAAPDRLHALVHAAGAFRYGPLAETPVAVWRALDAVNLHGPLALTARCLPALRRAGGTVVFVNSTAALRAGANAGAYAAGKSALKAAADVLRQEVGPLGIRVLSIFPGRTNTPMQDEVLAAENRTADRSALLDPADVAAMVGAALRLPRRAEVTDITIRPSQPA